MKYCLAVVTLLVGIAVVAQGDDNAKKLEKKLQGTWTMTSLIERGNQTDADNIVASFEGNKVTVRDREQPIGTFQFTINASKKPAQIDFKHLEGDNKDKVDVGIFRVEGDTLTVCINNQGDERPTAFTSKEGSPFLLCVLKRKQ